MPWAAAEGVKNSLFSLNSVVVLFGVELRVDEPLGHEESEGALARSWIALRTKVTNVSNVG